MSDIITKFGSAHQFYPTPDDLAEYMCKLVDWNGVRFVLEPSAGKGALCKAIKRATNYNVDILCVEKDKDLCSILRDDENYNVVQADFLQFTSEIPVDCIIMNPPFDQGAAHLLHAISLIIDNGGQIVCLLNAETLRNVNVSKERVMLANTLKQYGAQVKFLGSVFKDAERNTDVDVALVYLKIPYKQKHSKILESMQKTVTQDNSKTEQLNWLDNKDVIVAMVRQYKMEIVCGLELIREYEALTPHILTSFKKESYLQNPVLELKAGGKEVTPARYVRIIRRKYWMALFDKPEFVKRFTRDLQNTLRDSIYDMEHYDFTIQNICQLYQNLTDNLMTSLDDTILNMFEKLTYKNSMGCEGNIQYYNGWKTNDAYKINKRVIVPWMDTWDDWNNRYKMSYELRTFLLDLERVLTYLGGNLPESWSVATAADKYTMNKLEFGYFKLVLYKKGTVHIEFKDERLLKRLNLHGAMRKGWLPDSYGFKAYSHMSKEEQDVVDSFEGEKTYTKDLPSVNKYLKEMQSKNTQMLALQ